jgi:protein O-mannosyl-transferase
MILLAAAAGASDRAKHAFSSGSPAKADREPFGRSVPDRKTLLCCLALIVAVFGSYSSVFRNGFVAFDDDEYITENPHVQHGLNWATVRWSFTSFDHSNWHPLTWLSHAFDYQLFALKPAGHHGVNVLLHAINAALLFLFLQWATGFRWRSLAVAALFALHPINVESVAWASERKTVLSTLFFLLALHAYLRYARNPRLRPYIALVCFYAMALMAKPQVIIFPFLLWLLDYWPLGRIHSLNIFAAEKDGDAAWWKRRITVEKIPLLLLSAISAVLTMQAQKAGGAIKDFGRYGLSLRLETAVISYVRYLGMLLWPSKLVALYPHPTHLYPVWQVVAATLLLSLITFLVLRAPQREYLAVGWFWFLGSLFPMIGLVQVGVQALADRYAYISFIGLFVMIVWPVADSVNQIEPAHPSSFRWAATAAICWLLALGFLTHRQVRYWHDTQSFWLRTVALTEDNYVAHRGLAGFYHRQGKTAEALQEIRAVLAIRPEDTYSHLFLGDYEHSRKNYAAAIENYEDILREPGYRYVHGQVYGYLGYTYKEMGQPVKAKENFERSLEIDPNQPAILVQIGLIDQLSGDAPAAVQEFVRAMKLQPTDVGLLLLSNALMEEGHSAESDQFLEQAEKISKDIEKAERRAKELLGEK